MRIILLSGGSGKRLWPLSNEARPKQFLKLLYAADGTRQSMIQRVCKQLEAVSLLDSTHIVTSESQVEMMKSQIGDQIPIILEPDKRDTFPAIVLASAYLYSELKVDPNEIVSVLPVDPFVENEYFQLLKSIPELFPGSNAQLALVGAVPKYPSVQYGYILPEEASRGGYYQVESFVEKPDYETAKALIRQNALWNCGVFAFPLQFILSYLTENHLPTDYREIFDHYERLPKASFDIEIVERTKDSIVLPYHGIWEDIGNWGTITNFLEDRVIGLGEVTRACSNTHLINELPIPIHIVNVSNIVVAAGKDGILIADKHHASTIKQILKTVEQGGT